MKIERPGSPSATIVAPTSKRRSTSIETKRSRLASERPPKKGVASKNAFRSGELTAIDLPLPAAASRPSATERIYDKYLRGGDGLPIEPVGRIGAKPTARYSRDDRQPADRQINGKRDSGDTACPRRSGDRIAAGSDQFTRSANGRLPGERKRRRPSDGYARP